METKSNNTEYLFEPEGCYITELSNSDQDPDVSIAKARVLSGKTTAWHKLIATTERYVILSGNGMVEIGDSEPITLREGDVALIPPETKQRITNNGSSDLIFLAICSPRFKAENYRSV